MTRRTAPAPHRPSPAVELFEKAMKAMGKRDYGRARELFGDVIASHADQRDVVERSRAYKAICDRATDKKPSFKPRSFEELLNYGVFLHNKGEFQDALKYLQQAAEIHPKNENVLYCVAAAAARAGETEHALKALRSAIVANAQNRAQARSDSDFDPIREDEAFVALVHPQAS